MIKKFLLWLMLLCVSPTFSQVLCTPTAPCTPSGPQQTGTGMPAWLAFGTLNSQVAVTGNPATGGYSYIQPEGHTNWNIVQTGILYNPTEWQVYSNAAQGIVQVIGGTNQVVLVSGTGFSSSWIGLPYFYYEGTGFTVASVTDSAHLTVQTTSGGTVTWGATGTGTYFYTVTSTTSTCNITGTAVTWTAGQIFMGFIDSLYINGSLYAGTVTYNSGTSLTLSTSPGNQIGATCVLYKNIVGGNGVAELTNVRLQALAGSSEENFVITETPAGAVIQTAFAGSGKYRSIEIDNGEQPAGTAQVMAGFYPNATRGSAGFITLGGAARGINNQSVAIQPNSSDVNYLLEQGGITTFSPSIAARGSDTNVGMGFDLQGAASYVFSSHSFGNTEMKINSGAADNSWIELNGNGAGNPSVNANSTASNATLNLVPKGTGFVAVTSGGLQLPSFTVITLPSCTTANQYSLAVATDVVTYSANGTPSGGGTIKTPVFCNGTGWTMH
jgi:hypothetical protein